VGPRQLLWPVALAAALAAESAGFGFGDPVAWVPDLLTGWVMVGCGLEAWARRPDSRSGALLALTGFAWFAGTAWSPAAYVHRGPLVHLILTFPGGRASGPLGRVAIAAGYATALVEPVWRNEPATIVLAAALAGVAAADRRNAIGRDRRARRYALRAAAGLAGVLGATALLRLAEPTQAVTDVTLVTYELALAALAAGLTRALVRAPWERPGVTDLVVDLGDVRSGSAGRAGRRRRGGGRLRRDRSHAARSVLDVYCWRSCSGNVLLIHAAPDLVRTVSVACTLAVAGLGVAIAALAVRRGPRTLLRLAVGVAGLAESAYAIALLHTPLEDPELAGFATVHAARAVALVLVAAGVVWALFELLRTRARVADLATELGEAPTPGRLRDALAAALRDPALDVLYWLPGSQRFVDAGGVEREPPDDRRGTRITRGGRPLAILVHDPALSEGRDIAGEIGSATRLAIENEVLRAEVLAQLAELRQSRVRIVETGDAARRRLERDLHDGAQQQLLAVVLELRLARARADGELASALDAAGAEVDRAFVELREIAHGIYPAALTDGGLDAALTELAVTTPVAVEVRDVPGERFAPGVETSAYVAVADAIRDAAERGATVVAVRARQIGDRLVVNLSDDGDDRAGGLVHVADRVGAVGGELEAGRTGLRAEIPCAS
jgi:signal transduction histidine kinase